MYTHGDSHFPCANTFFQLNGDLDVQHGALQYQAANLMHLRLCCLQIWVKPSAEMQYMYGNHVMKSGLGRITENTPAYTGVVIYSMSDIPLGFGVTAKSTADCRKMDPSGIVVFHQADVGEWWVSSECRQNSCTAICNRLAMCTCKYQLLCCCR